MQLQADPQKAQFLSASTTFLEKKYDNTNEQQAPSNFSRMDDVDINRSLEDGQIMGNNDDQLAVDNDVADGQTVDDLVVPRNLASADDVMETEEILNEAIGINGPKQTAFDESMTKDVRYILCHSGPEIF